MAGRPAAWLSSPPNNDFEPSDVRILRRYVDGSLTLDDAADRITRPFIHPYAIWSLILHLAKEDVDAHPAFVKLINAIFALGKPEWSEENCEFGANWRYTHDSLWAQLTEIKTIDDTRARQWINYHAFTAECHASGINLGFRLAFDVIVEALERKLAKTAGAIQAMHRANTVAVAQYFIHSSRDLFEYSPNEPTYIGCENDSELWKGCKGYSAERWTFWRERWEVLRQNENLSDEEREAARQAEVSMGKAERKKEKKKR